MAAKLTFEYDKTGDILYITKVPPYPEQQSEELDDYIVARLNPDSGDVEGLEVLFFTKRLEERTLFEIPLSAELRLPTKPHSKAARRRG